jgi:hypothetical protein
MALWVLPKLYNDKASNSFEIFLPFFFGLLEVSTPTEAKVSYQQTPINISTLFNPTNSRQH